MTPKVSINEIKSYDTTGRMIIECSGDCTYQGFYMQFRLHDGGTSGFKVRGQITAPDPNTGFTLKKAGSASNASCMVAIYINDHNGVIDEKIIKNKVAKSAKDFYRKYHNEIKDSRRNPLSTSTGTLHYYLHSFKDAWLSSTPHIKSSNERSREKAFSLAEDLFISLDMYQINDITSEIVEKALKPLGKDARRAAKLSADFWDFCTRRNAISKCIPNPFKGVSIPATVKKNTNGEKQGKLVALTTEQESALQKIIRDNYINNPLYVGIALIVGAYFHATTVLTLLWKDVIFSKADERFVCIHIKKDSSSGGTLTYTRPVSLFAAEILRGYYKFLIDSGIDESKLAKMPVVSKKGVKYTSKDVTQRCLAIVKSIKVPHSTLNGIRLAEPSSGAGVSILRETYRNTLAEKCGLRYMDPTALSYLCSQSLNDSVTADRYRSFSSPEGLRLLFKYFCRDTRFLPIRTEPTITKTINQDGTCTVTIHPEKPACTASCTVDVILKPGDTLTIRSDSMLSGMYSANID